jgi:hypothetical protein
MTDEGGIPKSGSRMITREEDDRPLVDCDFDGFAVKMLDGASALTEKAGDGWSAHSDDNARLDNGEFHVKPR